MPDDSSWNTPTVCAFPSSSKVALSSNATAFRSISVPVAARAFRDASSSTVSVRSPRKSIFKSPTFSSEFMSNCVVKSPFGDL